MHAIIKKEKKYDLRIQIAHAWPRQSRADPQEMGNAAAEVPQGVDDAHSGSVLAPAATKSALVGKASAHEEMASARSA